jgi:cellulose synthase/poly-beta-1,6-N-acetylglucosamine synthase-like glycosyltransferase
MSGVIESGYSPAENLYPLISIVVPTYNDEKNLGRCLESIKGLDYPREKLEVIVVDDGSQDHSSDVARSYGAIVLRQPHQGRAEARNSGVRAARGEMVAFIDSDDVVERGWLRELLPLFHNEDVAAAGCSHYLLNKAKSFFARVNHLEKLFRHANAPRLTGHIGASGSMVRRDAFLSVQGFDATFLAAEDTEFVSRLRKKGYQISFSPQLLIGVTYPDTAFKYLHNQIRNSAYLLYFASRSWQKGRIQGGYSRWTDYIQSLLPSSYALGIALLPAPGTILLWSSLFLLLLVSLNWAFLGFVWQRRGELGRVWWAKMLLFLLLRSLAWNIGLIYGAYLAVFKRFTATKAATKS